MRRARRLEVTFGMVVLALVATRSRAVDVLSTDDGDLEIEAGGFFKPYGSWLVMPPALVEGTRELDHVLSRTRALLPESQAGLLPDDVALPQHVGITTQTVRLETQAHLFHVLDLEAAWQAATVFSSAPSFGAGSTQAGVLGSALVAPKRRLVDFDPYLVDDDGLRVMHNLDRLSARVQTPDFSVTVGRQALSWGSGRLWNPTDLLSPFAPTDVDREVRRGADALRVSLPIDELTQLDVLWLPQQQLSQQGFVARMRTNWFDTDVSWSAAKYVDDLVLGGDAAGDLGPLGVHAEAAWTLPVVGLQGFVEGTTRDATEVHVEDAFVRAVFGVDWRPAEAWFVSAEYAYNGYGATNDDDIVNTLRDPRVVRGEVFGSGRHYLGAVASYLASEILTLSATAIVNVLDPSALVVPALEYSISQQLLLRAGAFLPLAEGIDVEVFRALEPDDVLSRSDAFSHATTTLGARSEYGLTPAGAFVQLGVYLP